MSDQPGEQLRYVYEPEPAPFAPGATSGQLIIWDGTPGPAQRATAVIVTDDEGHGFFQVTSDFEDVQVIDDTPNISRDS